MRLLAFLPSPSLRCGSTPEHEPRTLATVPTRGRPSELRAWIHDRCAWQVGGQDPTEIARARSGDDLDALMRACPAR